MMPIVSSSAQINSTSPVVSSPKEKLCYLTDVEIDNHSANGAITITFIDNFIPDPSVGNSNPSEVQKTRKVVTVAQGDHYESSDEKIPIYGDLYVEASRDDSDVDISVEWSYE